MTRDELIHRIDVGRAELMTELAHVPEESMALPVLSNGWSIKDLLAHLAAWEGRAAGLYARLAAGREIDDGVSDFNAFNAIVYQKNLERSLADIRTEELQAFADLRQVAKTAPEAHLFNPAQFAWTKGRPFVDFIAWNSYDHYAEHLPDLRAWLEGER
jgi:hypothetical protein